VARSGLWRGRSGRRRWPLLASVVLLLGVCVASAAETLPLRAGEGADSYCERARASFERTGKLARELVGTLEGLDAEGPRATAERLAAIRYSFEQEVATLQATEMPVGAEDVQTHGAATLALLIDLTSPHLVEVEEDGRAELAQYLRDQLLTARNEARAAAAALRQPESGCASRRAGGGLQLLGRRS
jgi:hypothetical protein